ncbi:PREDICTED: mucin-3A-like, partial [Elephantulus edwardii]|uniref:mucin-3A-like n=1 Tax=Elephantulus edwardii TaxID=28737 RepID=UPI0003F0AE6E
TTATTSSSSTASMPAITSSSLSTTSETVSTENTSTMLTPSLTTTVLTSETLTPPTTGTTTSAPTILVSLHPSLLSTNSSSSPPSDTMTSSQSTHSTSSTVKTPETSVVTSQTPTSRSSPTTTFTTTQMTTQSTVTTTPVICINGGKLEDGRCVCLSGFSGDHCELENKCLNGGKWDGVKCICPSTFYGSLYTVDAEVGMEVSVDKEFTPELNDNTSEAYMEFTTSFQNRMKEVYKNVPGFQKVEILGLRNGSIVVDYVVLLELPFSPELQTEYEKVMETLEDELRNVSQEENSCNSSLTLCFKPDSVKVNTTTRTELSAEAICRRTVAQGYENFYFPLIEGKQLRCVSNCTSGVEGAIDCHQGQCLLEKSGPTCRSWDEKWAEVWDENNVGTFTNSAFEDDGAGVNQNFQIALENMDTNTKVQIQRPEVATSWT